MSIKDKYTVKSIKPEITYDWLLFKHYAHRLPQIQHAFGLYENEILEGVCTFGFPPTPFWEILFPNINYLELNRLVINDNHEKNALSYFVSQCLKKLQGNFVLISYADPNRGHNGYIYQATNWIYTGEGRVNEKDERGVNRYLFKNKEYHERHIKETMQGLGFKLSKNLIKNDNWVANGGEILRQERKHRYIYIIGDKDFKAIIKIKIENHFNIKPYPKGNNKRYDTTYKPLQQPELFA